MLSAADHLLLSQTSRGTPMGEYLRRFWMPALLSEELPEAGGLPVRVRLLGEKLVAFRDLSGKVGLLEEHCAHRGASLYFGSAEEGGLRCAYHAWRYDTGGHCLEMPNMPTDFGARIRQVAYPCVERAGAIWAWLGPPGREAPMPALDFLGIPDSHVYVSKRFQECHWTQAMDGDFDTSHVPYLHASLMVQRKHSVRHTPWLDPRPTPSGLVIGARRDADPAHYYWRITQWMMPFYTTIPAWPGDGPVAGHAWVPIDDGHVWAYGFTWHPARPLTDADRGYMMERKDGVYTELEPGTYRPARNRGNDYADPSWPMEKWRLRRMRHFQDQDVAITESMGPLYDRTREHLGPSDSVIVHQRNRLIAAAKALRDGVEPAIDAASYRARPYSVLLPRSAAEWWTATEARTGGSPEMFAASD